MEEQSSRAEERCGNISGNGEAGDGAINRAMSGQISKVAKGRSFGNIRGGEHEAGLSSAANNGKNDSSSSTSSSSFECNICLETAADPVVTLCGHLFCWPCVYRWLHTSHACPVCKAPTKEDALIPLYGRGSTKLEPRNIEIPNRPTPTPTPTPAIHTTSTDGYMSHQPYPYPSPFAQHRFNTGLHRAPGYELFPFFAFQGGSVGQSLPHRHNRHHGAFLHKVSVFLSCFVFVCLLSF